MIRCVNTDGMAIVDLLMNGRRRVIGRSILCLFFFETVDLIYGNLVDLLWTIFHNLFLSGGSEVIVHFNFVLVFNLTEIIA